MNVLFLSLYNIESINDGYIYADLIKEFKQQGHNVVAITPSKQEGNTSVVDDDGVKIIKIKVGAIQKVNAIKKVKNLLLLEKKTIKALKLYASNTKFDLVVTMVSNLSLYKTTKYIKRRDDAKVYMLLKDIFPQNAVDMEMINKAGLLGILYKFYKLKEKKYYKLCDRIGCLSPKNVEILEREFGRGKFEENPNTIIPRECPLSEEETQELYKKYKIPSDKKLFIYGGNIGKPQGTEVLYDYIKKVNRDDIFWIIAGGGTEATKLKKMLESLGSEKVKFIEMLPQNEFKKLLSICYCGLVFLNKKFTIPNYPSRCLTYMEMALPIVFVVDECCDAGIIACENGFGFNTINGDIDAFVSKIILLADDEKLAQNMGAAAKEYLMKNYITKVSYEKIYQFMEEHKNV